MIEQPRKRFLPSAKAARPCAVVARQSDEVCARCGRDPASQWRCFYERITRTAWRLVTGPLTPSIRWPRAYYSSQLHARVDVVVAHLAHQVVSIDEQLAFLEACERRPPREPAWRTDVLRPPSR